MTSAVVSLLRADSSLCKCSTREPNIITECSPMTRFLRKWMTQRFKNMNIMSEYMLTFAHYISDYFWLLVTSLWFLSVFPYPTRDLPPVFAHMNFFVLFSYVFEQLCFWTALFLNNSVFEQLCFWTALFLNSYIFAALFLKFYFWTVLYLNSSVFEQFCPWTDLFLHSSTFEQFCI